MIVSRTNVDRCLMPNRSTNTVAAVRIATGVFFLFFAEYKLSDSVFASTTFPDQWLKQFIAQGAVSFYAPFLQKVVLPHHVFFGYLVGVLELFIGLSLVLGLWVRVASVVGVLHMINLTLATWWAPGAACPNGVSSGTNLTSRLWRFFSSSFF